MDIKSMYGFENKNVFITGSASGMAKAATEFLIELGANIYAADINEITLPVTKAYHADLSKKEDIDAVLNDLPDTIDAVFLCHGVSHLPGKELFVSKVNFLSQKYIAEALVGKMPEWSSITFIASIGSFGWEKTIGKIQELLNAKTWEEGINWYEKHMDMILTPETNEQLDYGLSKQALAAYVVQKAHDPLYIGKKIRLNSINPGNTTTGLTQTFYKVQAKSGDPEEGRRQIERVTLDSWNGRPARPEEMGWPMVVLGSRICSYVSGQNLYIDYGVSSTWKLAALQGDAEGGSSHFING